MSEVNSEQCCFGVGDKELDRLCLSEYDLDGSDNRSRKRMDREDTKAAVDREGRTGK